MTSCLGELATLCSTGGDGRVVRQCHDGAVADPAAAASRASTVSERSRSRRAEQITPCARRVSCLKAECLSCRGLRTVCSAATVMPLPLGVAAHDSSRVSGRRSLPPTSCAPPPAPHAHHMRITCTSHHPLLRDGHRSVSTYARPDETCPSLCAVAQDAGLQLRRRCRNVIGGKCLTPSITPEKPHLPRAADHTFPPAELRLRAHCQACHCPAHSLLLRA